MMRFLFFFFFQAEDGIRDGTVTGVQTCALPISHGGAALRAADCGVGILAPGKPPPWGAHLICGPGLAAAHLVVEATTAAVRASRRSAGLAVAGSAVGGVLALSG